MNDLEFLNEQIEKEAKKNEFPLDIEVYQAAGLEPTKPILYAGNLKSHLCFFGRDLGKDEVYARQPLYGASGTLVRRIFYQAIYQKDTQNKQELEKVCERILLTNTVPYKPLGNKAYSEAVKTRFRPFIEQLLVLHWQGNQIITLGNEAFLWYSNYGEKGELEKFFQRSDRYEAEIEINLKTMDVEGKQVEKLVTLLPLPHPSPLNKRYYAIFPDLLKQRLSNLEF